MESEMAEFQKEAVAGLERRPPKRTSGQVRSAARAQLGAVDRIARR
jgi:hypothetical protein